MTAGSNRPATAATTTYVRSRTTATIHLSGCNNSGLYPIELRTAEGRTAEEVHAAATLLGLQGCRLCRPFDPGDTP